MNAANRVIVVVLALVLAALSLAAAGALFGVWYPDPEVFGSAIAEAGHALAKLAGADTVLAALVILVVLFGSAVLIALELRPARKRPFLVETTDQGAVVVEQRTVRDFIEFVGNQVSGVRNIVARVRRPQQQGLLIKCWVLADTSCVLEELASDLRAKLADRVQTQLGLPVDRIDTRMRMTPQRDRRTVIK